jgi:hypothetical protein
VDGLGTAKVYSFGIEITTHSVLFFARFTFVATFPAAVRYPHLTKPKSERRPEMRRKNKVVAPRSHEGQMNNEITPQHLTAVRMFRSLLPPSDSELFPNEKAFEDNRQKAKTLLLWPPNLFAFTSEILGSTGVYYLVVSPVRDKKDKTAKKQIWPPPPPTENDKDWTAGVQRIGAEWRQLLNEQDEAFFQTNLNPNKEFEAGELEKKLKTRVPPEVVDCWDRLAAGFDLEDIKGLLCSEDDNDEEKRAKHWALFNCIMTLHAIADEACLGWGIRKDVEEGEENKIFAAQRFAERLLNNRGTLATIHEDRCRVLPKRHTPNVGMTLRSISSNLAFYHRSSLEVKWRPSVETRLTRDYKKISALKILLLPFPYKIYDNDFEELTDAPYEANKDKEAFFQFRPKGKQKQDEAAFIHDLDKLLVKANEEAGRIDMVILPELALSEEYIEDFEKHLIKAKISGYIAGVRREADRPTYRFNRNMVYCKFAEWQGGDNYIFPKDEDGKEEYRQNKHHRWKLDRRQIVKYQLGGALAPSKVWWEGIKLSRRKVSFINIGDQITICPLICEDLARQEPISDLIRAVGPTLVVAILMDGPQKMSRWSAGYASVLADDPRSSVLTFTCLGMAEKAKTPQFPRSRDVALWKDHLNSPQEIDLEKGKDGIILYLNVEEKKENTADGRTEKVATPYLILGGISYV